MHRVAQVGHDLREAQARGKRALVGATSAALKSWSRRAHAAGGGGVTAPECFCALAARCSHLLRTTLRVTAKYRKAMVPRQPSVVAFMQRGLASAIWAPQSPLACCSGQKKCARGSAEAQHQI